MNRAGRLAATALLLSALALSAGAQGNEYSQPAFDPDHAFDSFLPVEAIDTFSGAVGLTYTDIRLPGPSGFDLAIVRWYQSKINRWDSNCLTRSRELTPIGVGWQMHQGRLWDNPDSSDPIPAFRLELPGGQHESFYNDDRLGIPVATYISSGAWGLRSAACVGAPGTCWIATSPSGVEYHFPTSLDYRMDPDDSYLYVGTIRDPIGNAITVNYDHSCGCNQAYVGSVVDAFGRTVQFYYQTNSIHLGAPRRLDRITAPSSTGTATYQYHVDEGEIDAPVLQSFQTPTGLTTTYEHGPRSGEQNLDLELKWIELPTGGRIEYYWADHDFYYPLHNTGQSIECTRVLTERRVAGASWHYDFPTGQSTDRTTVVTDPANDRREYTYTRYSGSGADRIWKAGLLENMKVKDGGSTLLEEIYTYEPFQFSNDNISPLTGYTEFAQIPRLVEKRTTHLGTKTARVTWDEFDAYNNPGVIQEYGFNGSLYRKTEHDYEHSNADGDDTTFSNSHIVDRVTSTILRSAGGTKLAETRMDYDTSPLGTLERVEEWTGSGYVTTNRTYDAQGQEESITVTGGGHTRATDVDYSQGILDQLRINGRTLFNRSIHTGSGLVTSESNVHGASTSFGYDSWGRLTSINPPQDATTTINWQPQSVTVSKGNSNIEYQYDDFGRLETTKTRLTGASHAYDRVEYDAVGNVRYRYESASSSGSSARVTFSYDALGRITQAVRPDGTTNVNYGADTESIADGTSTKVITRDAFGRITSVQEAGSTTSYSFDELDRLVGVDHPGAASNRSFEYSPLGWLTQESHPESGTTTYGYTGIGDLDWKQDADGDRTIFSYDTQGRLTRIDRPGSAVDVEFYYDGQGVPGHSAGYSNAENELTGMADETGTTVWKTRDSLGRVTAAERKYDGTVWSTGYAFDTRGNLTTIDYPHTAAEGSRTVVDYGYNDANLVDAVTLNGSTDLVEQITYNPARNPTTLELGNGVTIQIPTSPALRNRADRIYTVGSTVGTADGDLNLDYSYNSRGQVESILFDGRLDSYGYDSRGFLTGVTYSGQGSVSYGYDTNGNMTSRSSAAFPQLSFSRSYTGQNRIGGFSYSASGNLTSAAGQTYAWTPDNHLRSANGVVEYLYDGQGRLAVTRDLVAGRKAVDFHEDVLGRLARFTGPEGGELQPDRDWIYAAGLLIATIDHEAPTVPDPVLSASKSSNDLLLSWNAAAGSCSVAYAVTRDANYPPTGFVSLGQTPLESFIDSGALLASSNYFYLVAPTIAHPIRWYVSDHRGSTLMTLDEDGEVLSRAEYFPFGGLKSAPSCDDDEGVYQGKHRDPLSDLHDFGARHYSHALGRFLSPDTAQPDLRMPWHWNLYAYAGNDPINLLDPDGFAVRTVNGGINTFREIDLGSNGRGWRNVVEIAVNTAGSSLSDSLGLDAIADGIAVATDSSRSTGERVWGGTKAAGVALIDVAGGAIAKRVVGWTVKIGGKARGFLGRGVGAVDEGIEAISSGGVNALAETGAARGTEVVQRAMSRAELTAIQESGVLSRGGRSGPHYVSDAVNSNPLRARQRLSLQSTPELRVSLEVPAGTFGPPTPVGPNFNMPGGGMERIAPGILDIPTRVVDVFAY